MRLKTLLFNKGIFIQDIRNVGWVGLGYFLCLLFAVPLQLLLAYTNENHYRHYQIPDHLINLTSGFQIILTFIFPVLLAVFLFRYIQVKLSSDFTHSLPIKREQLFHQHLLFGFLVLLLPVLIVAAILLALGQFMPYDDLLSVSSILKWVGVTTLFNVFVFLASVFVGMLTGMSVLQGAFTYILFVFPVGVTVLFLSNLEFYLFGFTANYYLTQQLETIIPFIRLSQLERVPLTVNEVLLYVCFIVGLYLLSLFIYKKRHTETATQAIALESLRPVFKYGVTFCAMLVGGLYFGGLQGGLGWILFGYVTASLLGYVLAMMILEKTWRVFTKWKGYLVYLVVVAVLGFSFTVDTFGYEKKLPDVEDIEGIYFGDSLYQFDEREVSYHYDQPIEYIQQSYYYEQKELIQKIQSFHEQIIKERNQLATMTDQSHSVAFRYELKNEEQIVRQYYVPIKTYQKLYRDIIESEAYKLNQNPVLKIQDEDLTKLNRITINAYRNGKTVTLTDPNDIKEFHEWLQTDVRDETFDEALDHRYWSSDITYEWPEKKVLRVAYKKSYTHIEEWLKEKDLLDQARTTADDMMHAYVIKNTEKKELYTFIHENDLEMSFAERPDAMKIDDPKEIEELLKQASDFEGGEYVIAFYSNDDPYPDFQVLRTEHVPDFLRKKLP